jgi:hypothetical protein
MRYLISTHRFRTALFAFALVLAGCSGNPLSPDTPAPNTLVYDAPVSLTIKNGALLPGTSIAYGGKTDTGASKLILTGLIAPKQMGDSVDWQGTPIPDVAVKLGLRVGPFDDQSITLIGTSHIEIKNVSIKPGGTPGAALMEFSAPVSVSLNKGDFIPGSKVAYGGSTADGAQFLGIDGYQFRKSLDSLQYVGRINPRVFLRLDLRVLSFSDSSAVLGGTANIRLESQ